MAQSQAMEGVVLVPLDQLHEDPVNARKGSVPAIIDSLKEFGQHRPCVVQRSTGRIIAGNHLYKAAKALGWLEIGVYYVDDDDLTAVRRGLADNATGDLADWDLKSLAALTQEVGDDIPGFDNKLLDSINGLSLGSGEKEEKVKPTYPIAPKVDESYHCFVIFATTDTDWACLKTILEAQRCKSHKGNQIGECVVMTAEKFLELWKKR